MHERDVSLRAVARRAVDQLDSLALQADKRSFEIVDDVTDVMECRPSALRDEAPDTGVGIERLHELDPLTVIAEEDDPHALIGKVPDRTRREAERVTKEGKGLLDARDRHRDVMQGTKLDHERGGTYVPNTLRRSAQISPSVTSASTAARMSGTRFALPRAPTTRSSRE